MFDLDDDLPASAPGAMKGASGQSAMYPSPGMDIDALLAALSTGPASPAGGGGGGGTSTRRGGTGAGIAEAAPPSSVPPSSVAAAGATASTAEGLSSTAVQAAGQVLEDALLAAEVRASMASVPPAMGASASQAALGAMQFTRAVARVHGAAAGSGLQEAAPGDGEEAPAGAAAGAGSGLRGAGAAAGGGRMHASMHGRQDYAEADWHAAALAAPASAAAAYATSYGSPGVGRGGVGGKQAAPAPPTPLPRRLKRKVQRAYRQPRHANWPFHTCLHHSCILSDATCAQRPSGS